MLLCTLKSQPWLKEKYLYNYNVHISNVLLRFLNQKFISAEFYINMGYLNYIIRNRFRFQLYFWSIKLRNLHNTNNAVINSEDDCKIHTMPRISTSVEFVHRLSNAFNFFEIAKRLFYTFTLEEVVSPKVKSLDKVFFLIVTFTI